MKSHLDFLKISYIITFLLFFQTSSFGHVQHKFHGGKSIDIMSDFRLRSESIWNSKNDNGLKNSASTRLRVRFRTSFILRFDKYTSLGARIRTGDKDTHQSSHITVLEFNDNATGEVNFNWDKWYLNYEKGKFWIWIGRNSLPLYTQNEFVWDNDVTPAGLGTGIKSIKLGPKVLLDVNAGYFSLPVGKESFANTMGMGQVILSSIIGKVGLQLGQGILLSNSNPKDPKGNALLNDNGKRDYTLLISNFKLWFSLGERDLALMGDYLHNTKSYARNDPISYTASHHNKKDGYDIALKYGELKKKGDYFFKYTYAYLEGLAVNPSYATDEWRRTHPGDEAEGSIYRGNGLQVGYQASGHLCITGKLFFTKSLRTQRKNSQFRIDADFDF